MQEFKRARWVLLLVAGSVMAASQGMAQSTDTTVTRSKSNVKNNLHSSQAITQGSAPDSQEGRIKSHSNSANNREAQTGSQAGVTEESSSRIKTKSNIKNDRTAASDASGVNKTKSNVKNNDRSTSQIEQQKTAPQIR